MNTRNWVTVHHTGSFATVGKHQFEAVKRYHIEVRGWPDIAYQWFIERDGTKVAGRPEWMRGAHTWQWLMNYRSIAVCLAGNFGSAMDPADRAPEEGVQKPSEEQLQSLSELLTDIQLRNGIRDGKIRPHRSFAKYKTCPGYMFTQALLDSIIFPRRMRMRWRKDGFDPRPDLFPSHQ